MNMARIAAVVRKLSSRNRLAMLTRRNVLFTPLALTQPREVSSNDGAFDVPLKYAPRTPTKCFNLGTSINGFDGGGSYPGKEGVDWNVPTQAQFRFCYAQGQRTMRIPVKWERLQANLGAALHAPVVDGLHRALNNCYAAGYSTVILDCHSFGQYNNSGSAINAEANQALGGAIATKALFIDLWRKMAAEFGSDARIAFELMNEPQSMESAALWNSIAQETVTEMRKEGYTGRIILDGYNFANTINWAADNPGFPIFDPLNNITYHGHVYPDHDGSGTRFDWDVEVAAGDIGIGATSTQVLVNRTLPFIRWAQAKGVPGSRLGIGEWNVGVDNAGWATCARHFLTFIKGLGLAEVVMWRSAFDDPEYPYSLVLKLDGRRPLQLFTTDDFVNPPIVTPIRTYIDCPTGALPGVDSTILLDIRGKLNTAVTFTPSDGGAGGIFDPTLLVLPPTVGGYNPFQPRFTYRNPNDGANATLTVSNNKGLPCPSAQNLKISLAGSHKVIASTSAIWANSINGGMQVVTDAAAQDGTSNASVLGSNTSNSQHACWTDIGNLGAGSEFEFLVPLKFFLTINQVRIMLFNGFQPVSGAKDSISIDVELISNTITAHAITGSGVYISSSTAAGGNGFTVFKMRGRLPSLRWRAAIFLMKGGSIIFSDASSPSVLLDNNTIITGPLPVT